MVVVGAAVTASEQVLQVFGHSVFICGSRASSQKAAPTSKQLASLSTHVLFVPAAGEGAVGAPLVLASAAVLAAIVVDVVDIVVVVAAEVADASVLVAVTLGVIAMVVVLVSVVVDVAGDGGVDDGAMGVVPGQTLKSVTHGSLSLNSPAAAVALV